MQVSARQLVTDEKTRQCSERGPCEDKRSLNRVPSRDRYSVAEPEEMLVQKADHVSFRPDVSPSPNTSVTRCEQSTATRELGRIANRYQK